MDKLEKLKLLQLAGQSKLSGEVLAARWRLKQDDAVQAQLHKLESTISENEIFSLRMWLENAFDLDLSGAIVRVADQTVTWLNSTTNAVQAICFQMGTSPQLSSKPRLAMLGHSAESDSQVLREEENQTQDGNLGWKLTLSVDSNNAVVCSADVEVMLFDRWELDGTFVSLQWGEDTQIRQTDEMGKVHFSNIPLHAVDQIQIGLIPSD